MEAEILIDFAHHVLFQLSPLKCDRCGLTMDYRDNLAEQDVDDLVRHWIAEGRDES